MKVKAETTQLVKKFGGKRMISILGAMVVAVMFTTPARADTNAVSDALVAGVDELITAAVAAGGGDATTAVSAIGAATNLLSQAKAVLASSGLDEVKFGKKIDAAIKKLVSLEKSLEGSKWTTKSAVSKLSAAAKSLQKLADLAGSPLLEEVDAKTAGFHKAGAVVSMLYAIPSECTTWSVAYTESVTGVVADFDTNSVTGAITITLGSTRGSAHIVVTDCNGNSASRLIYNYGAASTSGLPEGLPTDLEKGDYLMTYSWSYSGSCSGSGSYELTTIPLHGSMKSFYKTFKKVMDAAVSSVSVSGCTQSVSYTDLGDNSFSCTITVSCTACSTTCVTCTCAMTFTFTKT